MPQFRPNNAVWILSLIAVFGVGLLIGKSTFQTSKLPPKIASNSIVEPSLFATQNATIAGKISKIDGDYFVVESAKGENAKFKHLKFFSIVSYRDNSGRATSSGGVENVKLNQEALISLTVEDGEYKVSAINYSPPRIDRVETGPPAATSSAATSSSNPKK